MGNHESALRPETVIAGPERTYTIRKVLGQGGFGITYLVTAPLKVGNITVQCDFAVKELFINTISWRDGASQSVCFSPTASAEIGDSLKSFIKEARRLHDLGVDDPNIVKINEVFEANNTAYYVMEYLSGQTLEDYVRRAGRLSLQETDFFMRPIVRTVADLHRRQVTHYDIKPLNIIIAEGEGAVRPVLIDFGLAKHYDRHGQATSTNRGGGYSPGYSPIEQYAGLTTFTPQADVYALGATLYYCLTGNRPADALALESEQVLRDLAALAPENIVRTIVRAMSLKPEDRPADASALYNELYGQSPAQPAAPAGGSSSRSTMRLPDREIPHPGSRHTTPFDPPQTPKPGNDRAKATAPVQPRSHKSLIIGILAVIALIIAGIIVFDSSRTRKPEPEPTPAVPEESTDSTEYIYQGINKSYDYHPQDTCAGVPEKTPKKGSVEQKNINNLHQTLSDEGYIVPSDDEFYERLKHPSYRRSAYDIIVKLHSYSNPFDVFEQALGFGIPVETQPVKKQTTTKKSNEPEDTPMIPNSRIGRHKTPADLKNPSTPPNSPKSSNSPKFPDEDDELLPIPDRFI